MNFHVYLCIPRFSKKQFSWFSQDSHLQYLITPHIQSNFSYPIINKISHHSSLLSAKILLSQLSQELPFILEISLSNFPSTIWPPPTVFLGYKSLFHVVFRIELDLYWCLFSFIAVVFEVYLFLFFFHLTTVQVRFFFFFCKSTESLYVLEEIIIKKKSVN